MLQYMHTNFFKTDRNKLFCQDIAYRNINNNLLLILRSHEIVKII